MGRGIVVNAQNSIAPHTGIFQVPEAASVQKATSKALMHIGHQNDQA
jgi:hypothetical protein